MVGEDSVSSVGAVDSSSGDTRMMYTGISCFANGIRSSGVGNGVGGATHRYKRRKCGDNSEPKLAQLQREEKMLEDIVDIGLQKESCEQVCDPKIVHHAVLNDTDSFNQHWRSTLQCLSLSFGADQGAISWIEGYIKDSLCSDAQTTYSNVSAVDEESLEGQYGAHQASVPKSSIYDVEGHSVLTSNGALPKSNNLTVTKQCQRAFIRLLMSDKITSLCKLFSDSFHGVKFDKVLDFTMVISRMKEGAYEQSPALFASDVQEAWRKLHVLGTEMISLAKSLSDLSRLFCGDSGGSMDHGTSDNENKEFPWFSDGANVREQPNDSVWKACACRKCGKKSDGGDCLVCDSCEEMFHVSCIEPPVKEIPDGNWYCTKCTALGIDSPHENCAVCEKLNVPTGDCDCEDERIHDQLEESLCCITEIGIQVYKGGNSVCCKVCKSILERGELFRSCEHHACNHYYHVRCLTNKQLKSYCSKWYCPCCLCRVCLTDKDDDKIVLCDACDYAYHIYCMSPPKKSIPEGQWYCTTCEAGLQAIYKAKSAYKSLEEEQQKEVKDRKGEYTSSGRKPAQAVSKLVDTPGGMDMLLSAASTISNQEQLTPVITRVEH